MPDKIVRRHIGRPVRRPRGRSKIEESEVDGAGVRFVGHRRIEDHYCQGGLGEDSALESITEMLKGVDALLRAKIGGCPRQDLPKAGIVPTDEFAFDHIEPSVAALYVRRAEFIPARSDNAAPSN